MPTPKSKRIVVLQSSYSPSNLVADFNLEMEADFTTHSTVGTANTYEDSSSTGNEQSEYKLAFSIVGGGAIGALTIGFSGQGEDIISGVSVAKTTATSTSQDPTASAGTVTPIASPDHYYERVWQQGVFERDVEQLDQVGGIDMRVKAESGYTVTQTVTSTDPERLIITYEWKNGNGVTMSAGTVSLTAGSSPFGDYTLGEVTVTDDPAPGGARATREGRKALRERIRDTAKALRRERRDARHDRRDR
jgi:hypothetical protein